jgi:hypothetical protein
MLLTRLATNADIEPILALQAKNLYANLSALERTANGFVTTPLTADSLKMMMAAAGVFIVENQNQLAGYALAAGWELFAQWPIFPYMTTRFPALPPYQSIQITADNTFQYGPICIDQAWRGTDAFPMLFNAVCSGMRDRFAIGVTFINQANPRSFAAHTRKLNLDVIDTFEFNDNSFYMLAFPTKR